MQSDPGTENFGIANAHTLLRQTLDPALSGYIQHRWMRQKKNVMPEITWSQLCRRFTPGFESLLNKGVAAGWYDIDNTLQQYVLISHRFLILTQFIEWCSDGYLFHGYSANSTHMLTVLTTHENTVTVTRYVRYMISSTVCC